MRMLIVICQRPNRRTTNNLSVIFGPSDAIRHRQVMNLRDFYSAMTRVMYVNTVFALTREIVRNTFGV